MSLFQKLFKKDNINTVNVVEKQTLEIKDLPFIFPAEDFVDKLIQDRISGKITEMQFDLERKRNVPHISSLMLAENSIILYRVAKSGSDIAKMSIEGHKYIEHKENSIIEDIFHNNGLSLTMPNALITCLAYGDIIVEIPFDKNRIIENNMQDVDVRKVGGIFDEYNADKVLTGKIFKLSEPQTLKMVIDFADNTTFEHVLLAKKGDILYLNDAFENFNLTNTLNFWEFIQNRYWELNKLNAENKINILRAELDELLKKSLLVNGNNVLCGNYNTNICSDIDENNLEK